MFDWFLNTREKVFRQRTDYSILAAVKHKHTEIVHLVTYNFQDSIYTTACGRYVYKGINRPYSYHEKMDGIQYITCQNCLTKYLRRMSWEKLHANKELCTPEQAELMEVLLTKGELLEKYDLKYKSSIVPGRICNAFVPNMYLNSGDTIAEFTKEDFEYILKVIYEKHPELKKITSTHDKHAFVRAKEIINSIPEKHMIEEDQYLELKMLLDKGLSECITGTTEQYAWIGIKKHVMDLVTRVSNDANDRKQSLLWWLDHHKRGLADAEDSLKKNKKNTEWVHAALCKKQNNKK